jgi:phosphate transport system substrate-binding protein
MQGPTGATAVLLLAAACAKPSDGEARIDPDAPPVRVDGSSTVYLVSKAVAEELSREGVRATVNESGTTGGFKKFCRGDIDIAGASRPIDQGEIDQCKAAGIDFYELPIGYDGLAIVVNRANDWVDHLTVDELKRMWAPEATGVVRSWMQIRGSFPDRPLHLFGPGPESGTFDYFTQAIIGTQRASRTDYTASEDDSVLVRGVSADPEALGYFGYAYARDQEDLRVVAIDDGGSANGDGPIAPAPTTVANGTYQPLSRPIFIYVSATSAGRAEVDRFVSFYLKAARSLSPEIGYVALPLRIDQLAAERYQARRTGTMFAAGASPVGVTMERLLEAQSR